MTLLVLWLALLTLAGCSKVTHQPRNFDTTHFPNVVHVMAAKGKIWRVHNCAELVEANNKAIVGDTIEINANVISCP